ncbi:hypothetical protein H4Q26_006508 [Puccinia striiformis f. sp. tritici PST-130]|nr:hypothetical protein H4Q26_006508 [Puccinia striiformis f. sp. tritici PST-130]
MVADVDPLPKSLTISDDHNITTQTRLAPHTHDLTERRRAPWLKSIPPSLDGSMSARYSFPVWASLPMPMISSRSTSRVSCWDTS